MLHPFFNTALFLYSLKTSIKIWFFFEVFRGYKKIPLTWNGLIKLQATGPELNKKQLTLRIFLGIFKAIGTEQNVNGSFFDLRKNRVDCFVYIDCVTFTVFIFIIHNLFSTRADAILSICFNWLTFCNIPLLFRKLSS